MTRHSKTNLIYWTTILIMPVLSAFSTWLMYENFNLNGRLGDFHGARQNIEIYQFLGFVLGGYFFLFLVVASGFILLFSSFLSTIMSDQLVRKESSKPIKFVVSIVSVLALVIVNFYFLQNRPILIRAFVNLSVIVAGLIIISQFSPSMGQGRAWLRVFALFATLWFFAFFISFLDSNQSAETYQIPKTVTQEIFYSALSASSMIGWPLVFTLAFEALMRRIINSNFGRSLTATLTKR